MSKAAQIMHTATNANHAMELATESSHAISLSSIDQDWQNEATFYTFDDDSVLLVSGPQVNVFESMDAAKAALV